MSVPTSEPESPNTALRRELAAQRAARSEQPAPEHQPPNPPTQPDDATHDPFSDEFIDPALRNQAAPPNPPNPRRRQRSPARDGYIDLSAEANQLLANPNKRLKTTTQAELLNFARARGEVRQLLLFHELLSQRDFQLDMNSKQWTMPKELKDSISTATFAVLLSPLLSSYVNNAAKMILDILETNGTIPAAFKMLTGRMKIIRKTISTTATNHRASIKKKLITSVKKKWHVGRLAEKLVEKYPDIKLTSALLTRLAFIRFQYVKAPTPLQQGDKFWLHVTHKLREMMQMSTNTEELSFVQKGYLTRDEALYTVGAKNKPTLVDSNSLDGVQKDVDTHMGLVVVPEQDEEEEKDDSDSEADDDDAEPTA